MQYRTETGAERKVQSRPKTGRQLTLFPNVSRVFPSDAPGRFTEQTASKSDPRDVGAPGDLAHEGIGSVDVPKVPPRKAAVDQLQEVLDSPEVSRLVATLQEVRWTGRPGYPVRAMVGMCLVKTMYALPTWSRTVRLVAEHPALQAVLGATPSQWACYRFARMLRTRDAWTLDRCVRDVLDALHAEHPEMGNTVAIDASDLPAYANGQKDQPSDPDAKWGHRSAVSTRGKGGYYGFKIHAAVDAATDLSLAWTIRPGNERESEHAIPLIDQTRHHGFPAHVAIMDKGYDSNLIHVRCEHRDVAPVIPLKAEGGYEKGTRGRKADPPWCVHGEWTFAGADYKRKATKWRCPTGECKPASMWVGANRLRPLIPRETKRYHDLYAQRGSVERAFARLKTEWGLTPLRVRGLARVQLHADLTILGQLSCALARSRTAALPLAA